MKCAILDDYQQVAATYFDPSSFGLGTNEVTVDYFHESIPCPAELVAALQPYEIIVAMRERTPFPADVLAELPKLKLLVTTGMRNLAIDVSFAKSRGIAVLGTRGFKEPPTELAWGLILSLARQIPKEHTNFVSCGPWQTSVGVSLHGKTLALLGLGEIGQRMARIGQAFGMNVSAWSQNLTAERCKRYGVYFTETIDELFGCGDFISIHVLLSDRTRGLVSASAIELMKEDAFLINTSRAAIVDEPALITALQERRIAGAGLDVFEEEPLSFDHPFRMLDNVLATPHLGYVADKNYHAYFHDAAENISHFLRGTLLRELS